MTTIATDGQSMAGDGRITFHDYIVNETSVKVRRLPSGSLIGFCGDSGDDIVFEEWLERGGKKPKLSSGFSALVLTQGRRPRTYFYDCTFDEIDPPYAIGSGARFAFAAMDCGKSPEEAVRIAAGRCTKTGGKVTVLTLTT